MKGKKIISAALAGVMALSLTACGGGSAQETTAAPKKRPQLQQKAQKQPLVKA